MNQERSPSSTSSDVLAAPPVVEKPQPAKRPRESRKRPAKRFLWQEDLHLRFVAAIFDLGLKNASPKALLPLMQVSDPDSGLTTEHLKSHLQKYRINYERSRREFQELCHREVKRNRKRRRREERTGTAYIFPPHCAKDRNDSSKNETDSDSDGGGNGDGNPDAEDQRLGPFVCSHKPAHAAATISTQGYPMGFAPVQQTPNLAPAPTPELTDAQWRSFCLLMATTPQSFDGSVGDLSIQVPHEAPLSPPAQARVQEDLQSQMHEAMQAQMNFHRQMLTRKVELSHSLAGMANVVNASGCLANIGSYDFNALGQGFERAWVTFQHPPATHTPQHVTQYEAIQTPAPPVLQESFDACIQSSSMPSLISTTQSQDAKANDVGDDLNRWDPFNVDLDGDDLFDFLRA